MPEPVPANTVYLRGGRIAWRDLLEQARPLAARLAMKDVRRVAWVTKDAEDAMLAAGAMAGFGISGAILAGELLTDMVRAQLANHGLALIRTGNDDPAGAGRTGDGTISTAERPIFVLTSGSTGTPKIIEHTWRSLYTARAAQPAPGTVWICPYLPGTYAWYQLVTLGMFGADQHLIPVDASDVEEAFARALAAGATAISSTPTFWRVARLEVAPRVLRALALRQITLGGERVDQAILDWLATEYPTTRLTHIYASSEAGAAIVVHDRIEGFPASWLDGRARGEVSLRLRDGRLWIRSPFAAIAGVASNDGWVDSGDLLELKGDRAVFAGRAEDAFVNVGGGKASIGDIESVVLSHPSVLWCKAYGRRAPLVGNLVCAQVVFDREAGKAPDERALTEYCGTRLPENAVPRMWQILGSVPAGPAVKSRIAGHADQ